MLLRSTTLDLALLGVHFRVHHIGFRHMAKTDISNEIIILETELKAQL